MHATTRLRRSPVSIMKHETPSLKKEIKTYKSAVGSPPYANWEPMTYGGGPNVLTPRYLNLHRPRLREGLRNGDLNLPPIHRGKLHGCSGSCARGNLDIVLLQVVMGINSVGRFRWCNITQICRSSSSSWMPNLAENLDAKPRKGLSSTAFPVLCSLHNIRCYIVLYCPLQLRQPATLR